MRKVNMLTQMATLVTLYDLDGFVKKGLLFERKTYEQISEELKGMYPGTRGFSVRSIKRFCLKKGYRKYSCPSDMELDIVVANSVLEVRIALYDVLKIVYI